MEVDPSMQPQVTQPVDCGGAVSQGSRGRQRRFTCPPIEVISQVVTLVLTCFLLWSSLWAVVGADALPGGNLFALFILVVAGEIAGFAVEAIHLPGLLGMLLMGFTLRNIPCSSLRLADDIDPSWSATLRSMALVVILLQAGLGLDPSALRRLSLVCVRLCCLPCIAESITAAVASHFILGFPWIWGLMLGFVLGAVTPAVIVPSLMSLQEKGYGKDQGIPTLIIAAASCDDVLAISAFGVLLGMAFSTGNVLYSILRGPLELVIGLVYGLLGGIFLWYIPQKTATSLRAVFLVSGGLLAVFGSDLASVPGAGALGCLTLAFIAGYGWKDSKKSVAETMNYLWLLFEPLLFGLIGAEVLLDDVELSALGLGLLTLFIGLLVRTIVSGLAVTRAGLNAKEIMFVAVAWLPKATVQAAIGSVALETARGKPSYQHLEVYGVQILTIAVLSIMLTAPLGAVLIALLGPHLLQKTKDEDTCMDELATLHSMKGEAAQGNKEEKEEESLQSGPSVMT